VPCSFRTNPDTTYSARGFRVRDFHDAARARGVPFARSFARGLADYRRIYAHYAALDPVAEQWLESTLALLDGWGERPVIVLTPMHPAFMRDVAPRGWTSRHADAVAYLRSLQDRYRFVLLDASRIQTFGGRASDFYDGIHMTTANTRRLVDWISGQLDGEW
jgi:hypothetical protein